MNKFFTHPKSGTLLFLSETNFSILLKSVSISSSSQPKTVQEKRLVNNPLAEKMKLEGKSTPDMGISWYKTFEQEFSKEYFQKVGFNYINQYFIFILLVSQISC
jgi:hypothetical protein